jgi:hypothetical protein
MECGGEGSFQAIKLQRLTRTTVCSHPEKGMATRFHQLQLHVDDIEGECLCCFERLKMMQCLLVQDNTQEGRINVDAAVVLYEAQFSEFVHEEIYTGASCTDHFRQSLLRNFG